MKKLEKLMDFTQKISESTLLKVNEKGKGTIDKLFQKAAKNPDLLEDFANDFIIDYKVQLNKNDWDVLFLSSYRLEWTRPENFSKEGYLEGGFAFNGLSDLYLTNPPFWKQAVNDFVKFEPTEKVDYSLLEKLRWVESLHHFLNSSSGNLPYTSCTVLDQEKMPNNFCFFDGGILYDLAINSYEDYVSALLNSAGVACWQYFYISPEEIVQKNNGVNYMTWVLKTSDLDERMNRLTYNEDITFDRLDLVAEYLERCIRLLPSIFPFLDFTYHINHYNKFKLLYDELRKK